SGRGRRTGLLERLRAARTTGSARTARTAGTSLGLAAEGRARRDRLGRAVHLGGPGTLVLVGVAAEGRAGRLREAGGVRTGAGRRRARRGRGVRGRRVRQEVPPALLAERRGALAGGAALRAELRLGL